MTDYSPILAIVSIIISGGATIIGVINHKRIRSTCCGAKLETSIDIENTTPAYDPPLTIKIPAQQPHSGDTTGSTRAPPVSGAGLHQ